MKRGSEVAGAKHAAASPGTPRAALVPLGGRLLAELRHVRHDPSDEDAVHDARVAARRLVAGARVWLPPSRARERLVERALRVVRRLGRARNLDIARRRLQEGPEAEEACRRELEKAVRRRRRDETDSLAEWMADGRLKWMKAAIREALGEDAGALKVRGPSRGDLAPMFRKLLTLVGRGNPMSEPERAHEIRREGRTLRYAHEALACVFRHEEWEAGGRLLERLQDAAGAWNDLDTLLRLVEKLERKEGIRGASVVRARLRGERDVCGEAFVAALAELIPARALLTGATATERAPR